MPGADGLELSRFIYEKYPQIKVILLSGYADFEYAKTAIKYNVSSFIVKPTNKEDLFDAVKKAQNQIVTSKNFFSIVTVFSGKKTQYRRPANCLPRLMLPRIFLH